MTVEERRSIIPQTIAREPIDNGDHSDYAPPVRQQPQPVQRTQVDDVAHVGQLTGAAIREAYEVTGKAIMKACNEVGDLASIIKADGENFVQYLHEVGEAHAARIEIATESLKGLLGSIGSEMKRIRELNEDAQGAEVEREAAARVQAEKRAREG